MKVTCNECNKEFVVNLKEYKHPVTKLPGYVTETYFRCPHCNKKYVSFVMDKQAKKMQKQIKLFHEGIYKKDYASMNLSDEEYKELIDKQHEELEAMKQKLAERMNMLKEKVMALN